MINYTELILIHLALTILRLLVRLNGHAFTKIGNLSDVAFGVLTILCIISAVQNGKLLGLLVYPFILVCLIGEGVRYKSYYDWNKK